MQQRRLEQAYAAPQHMYAVSLPTLWPCLEAVASSCATTSWVQEAAYKVPVPLKLSLD